MRSGPTDLAALDRVEIADVEKALSELWQETGSEHADDRRPLAWVRVLNLVVYTEQEGSLPAVERLADVLPARHPCRMVVIHVTPAARGEELAASISARCAMRAGGRREVCCEVITITAGELSRPFVANAVASLLVSGLPVAVWWTGAPRPDDEVFQELTAELSDQVIVDSRAGGDDAAAVMGLALWAREAHHHGVLGDLGWARILPWRQVIAAFFDPPPMRALLPGLCEVEVTCSGELLSADALLIVGWLAARLRWRLLDVTRDGAGLRAVYRSPDRLVDVRLRRAPAPHTNTAGDGPEREPRMHAVLLAAGPDDEPYTFRAYRAPDGAVMHTHVTAPGRPDLDHAAAMPERADEELLEELLGPRGRDAVYEAALARAAELAAAAVVA